MSVDPDGRKVIPNGSRRLQSMFLEQLQSYVSKDLELFQNDNGSLSYTMIRPYKKLRSDSKKLIDAIDSEDIAVNVLLKVIETFSDASMIGGAFMGNIYNESTGKVQTYQGIDPQFMEYFDAAMEAPGAGSIHEVIESYEGGIMAIEQGRSIPNSNIDEESYAKAHRKSTYVPNIKYDYLDKSGNILDEGVNASSIKFYYRLSVATGSVDVLYIITMPYKYK